ncbi:MULTISPECIES: F0F1 ATP synthase subunit B [Marinobacter]|uniref:ATP synthase subunit b n=1 Tax=Marinobacter metalliresistant TaxID=2961995 RepID=A0ABZ2VYQ7_9GAMM|nr:F0F1 ATP synthase subunit B [Marinobacter sp. Arc7-DN-1]AXS84038.1 F0F1 ATP synthase subunit B [Marinobacter sp. Arc7-DN-1]
MSVDWVTILAQVGNFLVLVWLLKRFLYKPILNGIDAREAEIATRMGEAEVARKKAAAAEAAFLEQKQKLLADNSVNAERIREQAEQEKDALLADTRKNLEREKQDWQSHLEAERERFTRELHLASAETLYRLVRRALHDLADEDLEEHIALNVIGKLKPLVRELTSAAGRSEQAIATTHTPLPENTQEKIRAALERLAPGLSLSFTTDARQAPGLILRIGSVQVAWTVDSYTDELTGLLADRLAAGGSGRVNNHG